MPDDSAVSQIGFAFLNAVLHYFTYRLIIIMILVFREICCSVCQRLSHYNRAPSTTVSATQSEISLD